MNVQICTMFTKGQASRHRFLQNNILAGKKETDESIAFLLRLKYCKGKLRIKQTTTHETKLIHNEKLPCPIRFGTRAFARRRLQRYLSDKKGIQESLEAECLLEDI